MQILEGDKGGGRRAIVIDVWDRIIQQNPINLKIAITTLTTLEKWRNGNALSNSLGSGLNTLEDCTAVAAEDNHCTRLETSPQDGHPTSLDRMNWSLLFRT